MAELIPLLPRTPKQRFSIELGDYVLEFLFQWVARFNYYRVDIRDLTGQIDLTFGRVANPDVNLLNRLDDKYGSVYISGPQPTLENTGVTAKLMWEPPTSA